jgi:hypothetical protein
MGLENAIKNAHEVARKTLNSTQKKMKRDYDVKILEKQYSSFLLRALIVSHILPYSAEPNISEAKQVSSCSYTP